MKRHIVTAFIFLLAIALYSLGAARPATVLLVLGLVAELVFWYRIAVGGKKEDA